MMPNQELTTKSAEETRDAAEKFAEELMGTVRPAGRARLICLWGNLGSGKTTFAQGFSRFFSVKETVNSPTFLIMKKYLLTGKFKGMNLYHFDFYRLNQIQELLELGWDEILSEENSVVLVEWPEKVAANLPRERINVKVKSIGGDERHLVIYT
jgi:tRNA threonylcarbamoyladenosine biosynthesis protein TsaE